MLRAGKVASTGMLLILLTAGISAPRPSPLPVTATGEDGVPAASPENEIKKTQQALRDKKHYRGKVDDSFGLRTRAGIRAYQKARVYRSQDKSIPRVQPHSESVLNRPGTMFKVGEKFRTKTSPRQELRVSRAEQAGLGARTSLNSIPLPASRTTPTRIPTNSSSPSAPGS